MELKIDLNTKEVTDFLKKQAEVKIRGVVDGLVHSYLRPPGFQSPEGTGYAIVRDQVENYLTSEEVQKKIDQYIRNRFDEELKTATEKALSHQLRKRAFTQEGENE